MSRRAILAVTLAFVLCLTASAFAEVQNVKVSGDILARGIFRNNFDLEKGTPGNNADDQESMFTSQVRLRVDADLTDNVATTVRVINERHWGKESSTNSDIDLDLAYLTLKEFLNPSLSLKVGRQEFIFGNSLIINTGNNAGSGVYGGVPTDLTLRKAFDGIRLTGSFDPITVDAIYAKVEENGTRKPYQYCSDCCTDTYGTANQNGAHDDIDLYGLYLSHTLMDKLTMDVYYFLKNDSNGDKTDRVHTIGTLLTGKPIDNLNTSLELAYQFGRYRATTTNYDRNAFAIQGLVNYTLADVKFTPDIGLGYTYLSGDKRSANGKNAWDSMFHGCVLNNITFALLPFTNLQAINLKAGVKPMDDLKVALNYGMYFVAKRSNNVINSPNYDGDGQRYYNNYTLETKRKLGDAVDATVTYDYTEDVQFGLTAGWFKPGKAFPTCSRRSANQVIGSMKVTF